MSTHVFGHGKTVSIEVESPDKGKVLVGDADVSGMVRSFDFSAGVGQMPTLHLDLGVHDATRIEAVGVEVAMTGRTRDLIIAAGWLPPEARARFVELADNFDISGDVPGAGDGVREVLTELAADEVTGGARG
jgi:hypothetical protein